MIIQSNNTEKNQSNSVANKLTGTRRAARSATTFTNNRPEAFEQKNMQAIVNNSPQVKQMQSVQKMVDKRPRDKADTKPASENKGVVQRRIIYDDEAETRMPFDEYWEHLEAYDTYDDFDTDLDHFVTSQAGFTLADVIDYFENHVPAGGHQQDDEEEEGIEAPPGHGGGNHVQQRMGTTFFIDLGNGQEATLTYELQGSITLQDGSQIAGTVIESIDVPGSERGQGIANTLLDHCMNTLPEPFVLECDKGGPMSESQLCAWYTRHGFFKQGRSTDGMIAMSTEQDGGGETDPIKKMIMAFDKEKKSSKAKKRKTKEDSDSD